MNISDLNYLEVVSENSNIVGGNGLVSIPTITIPTIPTILIPSANAVSAAEANAIGTITESVTSTTANAVSGQFSSSGSVSSASAIG